MLLEINMQDKIIMYDSDEACVPYTMNGWKSSKNRFYAEESVARYDGCTHRKCECGGIMTKWKSKCDNCSWEIRKQKYMDYPYQEWTGEGPICIFDGDKYFYDEGEVEDYCEEQECAPSDLMLVICKPNFVREIDGSYFSEALNEDAELPKLLQDKLNEFNSFLKTLVPVSWEPANIKTTINL